MTLHAPTKPKNKSIHPKPRKAATKLRRASNHAKNKQIRADHNRDYTGPNKWNNVGSYHSVLFALSHGTA